MRPEEDPALAALSDLCTSMRRGRFKDALPEEEQRQITLILTPQGAEVVSDTGAEEEMAEPADEAALEMEEGEELPME